MAAPPPPPTPTPAPLLGTAVGEMQLRAETEGPRAASVPAGSSGDECGAGSPRSDAAQPPLQASEVGGEAEGDEGKTGEIDFTQVPTQLEAALGTFDLEETLRPTLINVGEEWSKTSQKAILGKPSTTALDSALQRTEKDKAFDLLDALSRSGGIPLSFTDLHVIIAATHIFDASLIETVVCQNLNPIEKLEISSLVVARTVQGAPAASLIHPAHRGRLLRFSAPPPELLPPLVE